MGTLLLLNNKSCGSRSHGPGLVNHLMTVIQALVGLLCDKHLVPWLGCVCGAGGCSECLRVLPMMGLCLELDDGRDHGGLH